MFLSIYHFDGEPAQLQAAHARMLQIVPQDGLQVHLAVPRADGLDLYDTCPSLAVAEGFTQSAEFRGLLGSVGLPAPRIERVGDVASATLQGTRIA